MKRLGLLTLISILTATAGVIYGQAVATLESSELLMGKTAKMEISVPLPSDTSHVEFPLLKEAELQKKKYVTFINDTIEMLVNHHKALVEEGGRYKMRYDLTIQAFDSGRYEIPGLEFIVDGKKVTSEPIELSVIPVKAKKDDKLDDFSDIMPPFETNPNPEEMEEEAASTLLWWLIGAGILLILGIASYFLFRNKGSIFSIVKPTPAYKQALDKLKKLQSQNLPQRGRTKDYYTRLTDILRGYLKKQFGVKTFEKTSAEILSQMDDRKELSDYVNVLKPIFETSDFVKFAKVTPSETENNKCMWEAVRFIEISHPTEQVGNADAQKGGGK